MPFIPDTKTNGFKPDVEQEPKEKVGKFKGFVRDAAKPFLETIAAGKTAVQGGLGLVRGNQEQLGRSLEDIDFGFFGTVTPAGRDIGEPGEVATLGALAREAGGTGLEVGSEFVGGRGVKTAGKQILKRRLIKGATRSAKEGAKAGALFGTGQSLKEGDKAGKVIGSGIAGGVAGGIAGGALGGVGALATAAVTPIKTITNNVSPLLKKIGKSIQTTVLKPTARDMEKGFKIENIFKHGLEGSLDDTFNASTRKLKSLRQQASLLREGQEKVISIQDIMDKTVDDLGKGKFKTFGINKNIKNGMDDFVKEFELLAPDGKMTVPQAQETKEALGSFGSWLFGQTDLDLTSREKIANSMYKHIQQSIEKNSGAGLHEINKQMSEIIPIKNAVVRRIPVDARNNAISLTDLLSSGFALQSPKGWGLFALNRIQKSGKAAGKIFRAGEKLGNLKSPLTKLKNGVNTQKEQILLEAPKTIFSKPKKDTSGLFTQEEARKAIGGVEKPSLIKKPKTDIPSLANRETNFAKREEQIALQELKLESDLQPFPRFELESKYQRFKKILPPSKLDGIEDATQFKNKFPDARDILDDSDMTVDEVFDMFKEKRFMEIDSKKVSSNLKAERKDLGRERKLNKIR